MITKFLLNAILNHVIMSWIIFFKNKCSIKLRKIIIPICSIQFLGITQPYVQNCTEKCLKILLDM